MRPGRIGRSLSEDVRHVNTMSVVLSSWISVSSCPEHLLLHFKFVRDGTRTMAIYLSVSIPKCKEVCREVILVHTHVRERANTRSVVAFSTVFLVLWCYLTSDDSNANNGITSEKTRVNFSKCIVWRNAGTRVKYQFRILHALLDVHMLEQHPDKKPSVAKSHKFDGVLLVPCIVIF